MYCGGFNAGKQRHLQKCCGPPSNKHIRVTSGSIPLHSIVTSEDPLAVQKKSAGVDAVSNKCIVIE